MFGFTVSFPEEVVIPAILGLGTFGELFSIDGEKALLFRDAHGTLNAGCSATGYRKLEKVPSSGEELRAIILELLLHKLNLTIPTLAK